MLVNHVCGHGCKVAAVSYGRVARWSVVRRTAVRTCRGLPRPITARQSPTTHKNNPCYVEVHSRRAVHRDDDDDDYDDDDDVMPDSNLSAHIFSLIDPGLL